jgi:hypothetical protein
VDKNTRIYENLLSWLNKDLTPKQYIPLILRMEELDNA